MKTTKKLLAAALVAAICMPVAADAQEDDGNQMLSIMDLSIKHGHGMKFREAMTAYMDCYVENGGTNEWSTWAAVDGEANRMMIVSNIEMWAELDMDDPGDEACWPEHGPELTSHVSSANRQMFRRMPDWSGSPEGYSVVQLHQFRVEDGEGFREVVGEIVGMMKEADYEHMGTWYDAMGNQRWAADYFVVDHYENFAAMDEERKGANGIMVDALGEEGASDMWERFGDTLADMEPYWTLTLRRVDSLSHMASDE